MATQRKKRPKVSSTSNGLLPGEQPNIQRDVEDLISDSDKWLKTPNDRLGGNKPADLIGTDREQLLRDLLRAIKYGMPT